MTPEELRISLFNLAVQGKLVNQIESEGTADAISLLNKKAKKNSNSIENAIKPFEIPKNWKWVYLNEICEVTGGYAFKSSSYVNEGVRVVRISDFNENGIINNKIVRYKYSSDLDPYLVEKEDILLCMTGGTVGKSLFVKEIKEDMYTNQRVATIKILKSNKAYVNYVILSSIVQNAIQKSKNSTNDNISMDLINNFLIPLPPLEEQKRIVAKIEELLPLVDRYEEAWNKLEKLNKEFPISLEKSILQYAIEGKLVEQRENEGTGEDLFASILKEKNELIKNKIIKKEKALPLIEADEIPFDIPSSWKWIRLNDIGGWQSGSTPSKSESRYYTNGTIPWLVTGDLNNGILNDVPGRITIDALNETGVKLNPAGSVLIAMYGATIGKVAIAEFECTTNQACCACNHVKSIYKKYLFYYLLASKNYFIQQGEGGAQPNISKEKIINSVFPLPPYIEQERIVEKIEELLPLCRTLNKEN